MQLLSSWKQSLTVFVPSNFTTVLKTAMNGINAWFKYCWWLMVLCFVTGYNFFSSAYDQYFFNMFLHTGRALGVMDFVWEYSAHILSCIVLITIALSVKQTDQTKSYGYYLGYWRHSFIITIVMLVIYGLMSYFFYPQESMIMPVQELNIFLRTVKAVFGPSLVPYYVPAFYYVFSLRFFALILLVFMVVFLDSKARLKDIPLELWNTICITMYILPVLCGIYFVWLLCSMAEFMVAFLTIPFVVWTLMQPVGTILALSMLVCWFFIRCILLCFALSIIASAYAKLSS